MAKQMKQILFWVSLFSTATLLQVVVSEELTSSLSETIPQSPTISANLSSQTTSPSAAVTTFAPKTSKKAKKASTTLTSPPPPTTTIPEPTTTQLRCVQPVTLLNAYINDETGPFFVNSTVTYSCKTGFYATGKLVTTCRDSGEWTTPAGNCTIIDCHHPPNITDGKVKFNSTTVNSTAIYLCNEGFRPTSLQTIVCGAEGKWDSLQFVCDIIKNTYNGTCIENGPDGQCVTLNSACQEGADEKYRCQCKTGDFYCNANNSCFPRIALNVSCVADGPIDQCSTLNASCTRNGVCECDPHDVKDYIDHRNRCIPRPSPSGEISFSFDTRENTTETDIYLVWKSGDDNRYFDTSIEWFAVGEQDTGHYYQTRNESYSNYHVKQLRSGTNYTFYMYMFLCTKGDQKIRTDLLSSISRYTKPKAVKRIQVSDIWEKNVTITWQNDQERPCVSYEVYRNQTRVDYVTRSTNMTESYTFTNLTGGKFYQFGVIAAVPEQKSDMTTNTSYTRPEPVQNVTTVAIHSHAVLIHIEAKNNYEDMKYCIFVSPEITSENYPIISGSSNLTISPLQPSTLYTFDVFTYFQEFKSEKPLTVIEFTLPLSPENMHATNVLENSLELHWEVKDNFSFDTFILEYSTKEQDFISIESSLDNRTNNYTVVNLEAGTMYSFNLYTSMNGKRSENPAKTEVYTKPSIPSQPTLMERTDTSITLQFPQNNNSLDGYVINNETYDRNGGIVVINGLNPGKDFSFIIFTFVNETITSLNSVTFENFTLPAPPEDLYFPLNDLHETSMSVSWTKPAVGNADGYKIKLMNSTMDVVMQNKTTDTTATFKNLRAGEQYIAVIHSHWNGLLSYENNTNSTYTRPPAPSVKIISVTKTSFCFSIEGDLPDGYKFVVNKSSDDREIRTVNFTRESLLTIDGLTAGILYNIYTYAIIGGIVGENPQSLKSYTEPNSIDEDVITVDQKDTSSSMIAIKWKKPNGSVSWYEISFCCVGPNSARDSEEKFNKTTNITESYVEGLDPGTLCSVNITTHVGNQTGDVTTKQLDYSTDEKAPEEVIDVQITTKARSLEVTWTPPSVPNGVVRKYVVDVLDTNNSCAVSRAVYSCTDCSNMSNENCTDTVPIIELPKQDCADSPFVNKTGQFSKTDNFNHSVGNLQPSRNYTVVITPFTRCFGTNSSISIIMKEATPGGAPRNINKLEEETTKDKLVFSWLPPALELQNGKIINYTITIMYYNQTCYSAPVGKNVTKKFYANNVNISGMNKYHIDELFPYWSYNVSIAAWTEVGEGVHSTPSHMMTNQTSPGPIRNVPTTASVSNSSVSLNWTHPCLVNGVIGHYQINIYSNNNDSVTIANSKSITGSNDTRYVVTGLHPYHNYTFSVSAVNVLGYVGSPVNTSQIIRTETGKPYEPTNVTATAISSEELKINWVLPALYTGVTNYTIIATDAMDNTIQYYSKIINNFYQTEATVRELDEYWNYTITVTAITSAGNTTSSVSTEASTLPSVPGVVENVDLHNETNITLPRSIRVTWDKPTVRNLNGILRKYFITFTADIDGEVVNKTINISANIETLRNNWTISNIKPGIYSVAVYAATEQGPGIKVTKDITIYPGAPLIIKESASDPLMKKSNDTSALNDTRTQIAIQIPLNFLCDDSNGKPNEFGIVIAANTETTNDTYNGDAEGFSSWKKQKYKSWFQVHNQTNPKPYITSYPNWNPCQGVRNGQRKRRSTGTASDVFVIGADGKCSGKSNNEYCNGELRPGTSYRFKAYTCTIGGCTETRYSNTVETQKAEKLAQVEPKSQSKVPAIVGAVSACVVFILVITIVVQMRRRQAACFAKRAEEGNTHRRSEPIPATEMSRVDRPTSVIYKPESVRLSEFPDYVDRLKKDSLLILSDLYKLLKEKSPRHSCSVAESQICRPKNRYTNILPFDHSRVKILPLDDEEGSDYINANYIPGYTSRREYIATQGPMPATYDDFWRMVWEQNVEIIVMLTKLMEKGRNKCDKYWPNQGEPQFYGDLSLSIISESNLSDYTIRIMEIKLKGEKRRVKQFSFLKWPDMGCPEYPESLLEFVKNVRQHQSKTDRDRPIVVHCSAGVGRTGTFIAVDHLLQHIRDHDEIDIYNLVLEMRNNRCNMVQTEDQFVYIHECIREFITNDDDEEDYDDEDENLYANTRQENVYENTGFSKQF